MIAVHDLHKRHGSLEIIKGISLNVAKGDVAAIIGPSGGGKSTFLRCINGLERFQGGTVKIGDYTLTSATSPAKDAKLLQDVRKRVGFVFQQFNLFPHLTVLGNCIEAPLRVNGEEKGAAEARAMEILKRVGLEEKARSWPHDLSGGQQQRVAIARTLAMQPECILFDEPTSALDPVMAGEVLKVITALAEADQTMIVVTHSMMFAREVCDHVHVFAGGHDVEWGPPGQVFGDPQHETTRSFLRQAGQV
ncbi:MAG: amino acid ABC transporter ATP-binding protein [Myxococcales bacterium]|nr:amino acid ABC transporter ATP-binding protein [Myxococcales bacterium]